MITKKKNHRVKMIWGPDFLKDEILAAIGEIKNNNSSQDNSSRTIRRGQFV